MGTVSLHRKLRQFIGQKFDYLGEVWILIEVLADNDSVVLRRCSDCKPRTVQHNAYGLPTRRSPDTLTLPISARESEESSQDILVLLEGRQT